MSGTVDPPMPIETIAGAPLHTGASLDAARLVIVLVHGRGGSAADILRVAKLLERPGVAFLAPQAAGGSWYPQSFLAPFGANEPYLSAAHGLLASILADVAAAGVPADRCGLVGFSQGACLASDHVARFPKRYGLLAAYTGGLIGPPATEWSVDGDLAGTPVFLGANDPDPHVPWERVAESAAVLEQLGASVELQRYPGEPHTILADEIVRTGAMLDAALTAAGN